jgi:hypothetical protein
MALRPREVDLTKLTFSDVRSLPSGAKMVFININENSLYIQTPEVETPFDSMFYPDGSDETGKITVNVSLKGFDEVKNIEDFHKLMTDFDVMVKDKCIENSVLWHKKPKMSMETVESLYTNMVKVSTDPETGEPNGKYPPQFRYKINKKNGKWECRFYDEMRKPIENPNVEDLIKKGSKVKALLKCTGIWIAGGKFGCSWKAEQIIINAPKTLDDYAFRSDDEDDDQEESVSGGEQVSFIDDSSDDSDDGEEEEVVVKPKKTAKSTRKK